MLQLLDIKIILNYIPHLNLNADVVILYVRMKTQLSVTFFS